MPSLNSLVSSKMDCLKDNHRLTYLKVEDPPDSAPSTPRPLSPNEQYPFEQGQQHAQQHAYEQAYAQSQLAPGFWGAGWSWEIVSCVIAIGSLAGIIVVLYIFDGQSTPDWPYGITLNALISVLVTVMKAAMAFPITEALSQLKWSWFNEGNKLSDLALLDAASRGAVGAVVVLFRFIPRHLVTIGCFIIVIASAIAPFVQQVIAIDMRLVHSSEHSSIQVCNSSEYNDWDEGSGPGMNKVPLSTTGAIYTGIFESSSPNSNSITMDCPTGNCTFAPYQSLGFCSKCANITDSLDLNVTGFSTLQNYKYTLPNNWDFTTSYSSMYLMNATADRNLVQIDPTGWPLITNFTAITAAGYGIPPSVSATECAISFCVKSYQASVKNGKFSEKLIDTDTSSNYTYASGTQNIVLTPKTCYYNGSTYHQPSDNENCTFNISWLSLISISNSLRPLLKGKGSLFVSNRPDWSSETARAIYGQQGNLTEISSMFDSLASALTTHARSKVCTATTNGTTWTVESYVHVRWLWMILPIALVAFTLIFFIATIWNTRNQFIWKSSPLALLFSNVDAPEVHPELSKMEKTSQKIKAKLETTANGVRLRHHP